MNSANSQHEQDDQPADSPSVAENLREVRNEEGFYSRTHRRRTAFRKGVFVLPNLITSASLFCGFFSMVQTVQGNFTVAAWAILASAVFDAFDGTVARMTNTASEFGVEYDSLSDAVAFGVAPALMMYEWALQPFGKWGWAAAFVVVACAVLRLARFNVQTLPEGGKYFTGLPAPGGGGMIATTVLFYHYLGWSAGNEIGALQIVLVVESFIIGMLMVSNVPYLSSKKLGLEGRVPFIAIVPMPLALMLLVAEPEIGLFSILLLYVAHGPVLLLLRRRRKEEVLASETE